MTSSNPQRTSSSFTDIHHHILYGVDDGPATFEQMTQMLKAAHEDGTGVIIATPHASPGIEPFAFDAYRAALEQANAWCRKKAFSLRVLPGAEVYYTQSAVRLLSSGAIPTLCESEYVLVEWNDNETQASVEDALGRLCAEGFIPVMAHVERLRCFLGKPKRLMELRDMYNIRLQADCSAVLRSPLSRENRFVCRLCAEHMLDFVASDAHGIAQRSTSMHPAHEKLTRMYGQKYADALMMTHSEEIIGNMK